MRSQMRALGPSVTIVMICLQAVSARQRTVSPTAGAAGANAAAAAVEVLQIRPNFFVVAGAGANIAVQIGADGVVLVDAGTADKADQVIAEVKKLSKTPIRYVINTSADDDHVGGNETLSRAGESVIPTGGLNNMAAYGGRAPIVAEEHVQNRMSAPTGKQSKFPEAAWPTSTYSSASGENRKDIYINGEAVQLFYQPAAHSDADSLVFFRRSDIIVSGEAFDITRFPAIDIEHGGTIQGVLDSLNRIVDLAVPAIPMVWQEGGTVVIPSHGRICSKDDVVGYRDMVTIVRDAVQDGIKKGLTLDQIKRGNPTQGYRKRFGSDRGAWTTDNFVEAVYKGLRK
jgi:cyclase